MKKTVYLNSNSNLAVINERINKLGGKTKVSELNDFPFDNYSDFVSAVNSKQYDIVSDYNFELYSQLLASKTDLYIHLATLTVPLLIILTDIILSLVLKNWLFLLGVPLAVFGFFSSSPYNKIKKTVSGLGCMLTILFFFTIGWKWSVIVGSMLFSQMFVMIAREQYRMAVHEYALKSETVFSYLFSNKLIDVLDNVRRTVL